MFTNLLDWFKIDLGEGAFYSIFGFVFVFLGIVVLILILTLLGMVMKRINARNKREKKPKNAVQTVPDAKEAVSAQAEGLSPEVIAVIAAAVSAYCEESGSSCGFVVKRIKKL